MIERVTHRSSATSTCGSTDVWTYTDAVSVSTLGTGTGGTLKFSFQPSRARLTGVPNPKSASGPSGGGKRARGWAITLDPSLPAGSLVRPQGVWGTSFGGDPCRWRLRGRRGRKLPSKLTRLTPNGGCRIGHLVDK
jgi:hypothetical protein